MQALACKSLTRAVLNICILCVSFTAGLVAVEYTVRWARPNLDPSKHIHYVGGDNSRPILGPAATELRIIRNNGAYDIAVRFNAHGLRDTKDLAQSKTGDLFVVGDSQCMGYGIAEEKRFSNSDHSVLNVPIFKLCIPGSFENYEKLVDYAIS